MASGLATSGPPPIRLFDWDDAPYNWLHLAGKGLGWSDAEELNDATDTSGVAAALAKWSQRQVAQHLLVLHIDDDALDRLVGPDGCAQAATIVRCSSSTSPSLISPWPSNGQPLVLNLRLALEAAFSFTTLKAVLDGLTADNIDRLREGHLPEVLGRFFAFRRPDHLAALLILVEGARQARTEWELQRVHDPAWWLRCLGVEQKGSGDVSLRDGSDVVQRLEGEAGVAAGGLKSRLPLVVGLLDAISSKNKIGLAATSWANVKSELEKCL